MTVTQPSLDNETTSLKRKAIPKKIRFEVLKRDAFTCQYCGAKAPDTLLHVDHIQPVSKGGTNDPLNLVASCQSCNGGKSNHLLSDTSTIERKRQQLSDSQERKEQLDMLIDWQQSLVNLEDHTIKRLSDFWAGLTAYTLTAPRLRQLRTVLKKRSVEDVMQGMRMAIERNVEIGRDGYPTMISAIAAFEAIPKICSYLALIKEKPYMKELYYIRGILRKHLSAIGDYNYPAAFLALDILKDAHSLGVSVGDLRKISEEAPSFASWKEEVAALINKALQ